MRIRGTLLHPRNPKTGEELVPLGVRRDGRLIWPVMGASPEDDSSGADDDDDDDDDKGDDDSASGGDDKADDDDAGSDGDDDKVSKADFEAMKKRMRASDKRADDNAAKLRKIEDAKKDDLTKATDDLNEAQTALTAANETIASLRLENAFLGANKHAWHDGDTALSIAQSKGYLKDVVDDDGEVDKAALAKALDKLAKDNAFLVNSDASGAGDDDEDDRPSGVPAGGRKPSKKADAARQQKLRTRFPAAMR